MNKLSIITVLAATAAFTATVNLAVAQSAGGSVCGRAADGSLTCVYDEGNVDNILTLTRCDNEDTRPSCSSVDLDLDAGPQEMRFGDFNDICQADTSFPGHLEISCFGIPVLECDDIPFQGWSCH
ncbi:MAG: hypothetical protein H0V89_00365 [Deltaproteobacteria bacterium]|nr:hypothetical protein [Deltaproteobacteria bacterium]